MASEFELATNQLLRQVSFGLPDALAEIDAEMLNEDNDMSTILGPYYAPFPTPVPVTWMSGQIPLYTTLNVEQYPVLSCTGTTFRPTVVEGGDWQQAVGEFIVQVIALAEDTTFLYRFLNRYANAVQRIIKNTTLGGLVEPIQTAGRVDLSNALNREFDETKRLFYAQSMIYRFQAEFVVT